MAVTLHALVLSGAVLQVSMQNTEDMPQTKPPKAWVPVVDGAPVDNSTAGNPHIVTATTYDATGNPVIRTQTTRDMTPEEFPLTGPEWFTLVKGLPSAQKSLIRNTVNDTLALVPSDAETDAAYRDIKRRQKAARFLSNEETDKPYGDVLLAFSVLVPPIVMTGPQTTNFRARWVAVGAI